jgi:hypothetical protein
LLVDEVVEVQVDLLVAEELARHGVGRRGQVERGVGVPGLVRVEGGAGAQ